MLSPAARQAYYPFPPDSLPVTRSNQQVYGTAADTYTMLGIASAESKAAQGTPTYLVTSNESGDLAAHTPGDLGLLTHHDLNNINNEIRRNTEGVALAIAMAACQRCSRPRTSP
jgi:trimeric autotransporter adhesin